MRIKLPPVLSVNEKSPFGRVAQIREPGKVLDCNPVRFTFEKSAGYVFTNSDGEELFYLFAAKPKESHFAPQLPVLLAKYSAIDGDEVDLSGGQWWQQPSVVPSKFATQEAESGKES